MNPVSINWLPEFRFFISAPAHSKEREGNNLEVWPFPGMRIEDGGGPTVIGFNSLLVRTTRSRASARFQTSRSLLQSPSEINAVIQAQKTRINGLIGNRAHNKFPRDTREPMSRLFNAIMGGADHARLVAGSMRVGFFDDSKQDSGSILADNIAGSVGEQALQVAIHKLDTVRWTGAFVLFAWQIWAKTTYSVGPSPNGE